MEQKTNQQKTSRSPLILINGNFMWEIGCSAEEISNLEFLSLTLHVYSLMLPLTLSTQAENNELIHNTTQHCVFLSLYKQRNCCGRRVCLMVTRTHGLINSSFAVLSGSSTFFPAVTANKLQTKLKDSSSSSKVG